MTTELRWQRLQTLFHAACERPVEQRQAFVHQNASDDPQLLEELRVMLEIEESATIKVSKSMQHVHSLLESSLTLEAGTRFGPWAIIRPIGQGGMGQVYLARRADGAYERTVALKLLSLGQLSERQRAYFEVERQLLAQMYHPAIAQIHDAGTDDLGRPWLAMEYIEGDPITTFCEDNALSLHDRLRLFLRVCDGVMHAHQKGVVHRDIKPGNILVNRIDGYPRPHLLDFGISIAVDAGSPVAPAGTPGYMSPEQASPDHITDSRSDVYSLGALLYELLSGRRPSAGTDGTDKTPPSAHFDTITLDQFRVLAERRGVPPKKLQRLMREDLDWIVLKAMEPEPDNRYSSVSQLEDDLQRFLSGYPVNAAPMRRHVAVRKFVARHRVGVSAGLLLMLALLGGLGATAYALKKADQEASRAQATVAFLGSLLSSVDPDVSRDMDKSLLRHVLDEASRRSEKEWTDDPEGRNQIELIIAESYSSLGLPEEAMAHLEAVKARVRAESGAGSRVDVLVAQRLGTALVDAGHLEASEAVLREAIAAAEQSNDQLPPSLVSDLRSRLSWTLLQRGNINEALTQAQQGYDELRQRVPENHPQRLDAGGRLAIVLDDLGRSDEAISLIQEVIAQRGEELGRDHPRVLNQRLSLAVFYLKKKDFAAGEKELKALLEPVARQHGQESPLLAMVHNNLGGALRQQGKVEEAGPHYQYALDYYRKHSGEDAPNTIMARHNHANWLLDDGQSELAMHEQEAALAASIRVFGEEHPATAEVWRGLGQAQIQNQQLVKARASLERARQIKVAVFGEGSNALSSVQETMALLEQAEQEQIGQDPAPTPPH